MYCAQEGENSKSIKFKSKKNLKNKPIGKKLILLIEDNPINIKVARLLLQECGIEKIDVARNGAEALTAFNTDVDLVILDLGLPDISGIEVCKNIRAKPEGKNIPIIICTADGTAEQQYKAIGADDYLIKPITLSELQSKIQRWC